MIYLVVYDIPADNIRNRLSKWLEQRGTRVQESVFECSLESDLADDLAKEIEKITGTASGNVRIYQVCRECYKKSWGVGGFVRREPDRGYIIV